MFCALQIARHDDRRLFPMRPHCDVVVRLIENGGDRLGFIVDNGLEGDRTLDLVLVSLQLVNRAKQGDVGLGLSEPEGTRRLL